MDEITPHDAQQRLAQSAMKTPMSVNGAAISAFVNGTVNGATLAAIVELLTSPYDGELSPKERFEQLVIKHCNVKADLLDETAKAPQLINLNGRL